MHCTRVPTKSASIFSIVLALALLVSACGDGGADGAADANSEELQELVMLLGTPENLVYMSPLVARELGYFEDEGLDVRTEVTGGSGFTIQQLVAGNADYGWPAAGDVVIAEAQGSDMQALTCHHQRNIFRIVTPDDSDVMTVTDLRDKKLGISEVGGGEAPTVDAALQDAGLSPGEDVELVPIGDGGPQTREALESGAVDAYATSFPDIASLEAAGVELREITPEKFLAMPGACLTVLGTTMEDDGKRDIAIRLARAWTKGSVFTVANPEAAIEIVCEAVPEDCQDPEFAEVFFAQAVAAITPVDAGEPVGSVALEGWATTAEALLDAGTINAPIEDPSALIADGDVRNQILDFDEDAVVREAEEYGG